MVCESARHESRNGSIQMACVVQSSDATRSWCCDGAQLVNDDWLPICSVDPPMDLQQTDRGFTTDLGPSIFLPLWRIWHEVAKVGIADRVVVNYGARDGRNDDPTYTLFNHYNATGLAVEASAKYKSALPNNLPGAKVLCPVFVTPENAVALIEQHGFATDFDVFKLDIDRCEGHLLDLVLERFTPKIIMVEVNQYLPPPFLLGEYCGLSVRPVPGGGTRPATSDFSSNCMWGSSAAYVYRVVQRNGDYRLLQFDWPDLIFVHRKYAHAFSSRLPDDVATVFATGAAHARQFYHRYVHQDVGIAGWARLHGQLRDYQRRTGQHSTVVLGSCEQWHGHLQRGSAGMYDALLALRRWTASAVASSQPVTVGLAPELAPRRNGTLQLGSILAHAFNRSAFCGFGSQLRLAKHPTHGDECVDLRHELVGGDYYGHTNPAMTMPFNVSPCPRGCVPARGVMRCAAEHEARQHGKQVVDQPCRVFPS